MHKGFLTSLLLMIALCSAAQSEKVIFSDPGGFYENGFPLSLYCFYTNHHIRYTTNGDSPTASSPLYTGPLTLDGGLYSTSDIHTIVNCIPSVYHPTDSVRHAIVIRASVFDENGNCISEVATQSYLIRSLGCDTHGLPVLSIVADSLSLFDYETGIFVPGATYDPADSTHTGNYYQRGREWERVANMEFYESDNHGINQLCGLRTHGGASRWYQQKGMKLYAREDYGKNTFNHKFFETTAVEEFKRISLHPFRCSNWLQTGGQEYLAQTVAATLDIDAMAVRQVVVFLNGEYWGLYTLEESPDEHYIEEHFGYDSEEVNILKYWSLLQNGDGTDWWNFYDWINDSDLSQPDEAAYAYERIDVSNFIDYMLFGIYSANLDWPQNNVLQWQAKTGEPFRWLFFDGDGCFTRPHYEALFNALNQGGNSKVFKHFMENESFRYSFFKRYEELLGTSFSYPYLQSVLDTYRATVEDEIASQSERFGFPTSLDRWNDDMEKASEFFRTRNDYFRQEALPYIFVEEHSTTQFVCVPNPSSGTFQVFIPSSDSTSPLLEIYDMTGRLVFTKRLSDSEKAIPIQTSLPAGLYVIKLGTTTSRLVITK